MKITLEMLEAKKVSDPSIEWLIKFFGTEKLQNGIEKKTMLRAIMDHTKDKTFGGPNCGLVTCLIKRFPDSDKKKIIPCTRSHQCRARISICNGIDSQTGMKVKE